MILMDDLFAEMISLQQKETCIF